MRAFTIAKNTLIFSILSLALSAVAANTDSVAKDPVQVYRQRQADATPASILNWLKEGNQRFAKGKSNHGGYVRDARERIQVSAQGQRPLATVLSCIDSRTTPEPIFDTSVGDLFTARVGANVVNDDILGSSESIDIYLGILDQPSWILRCLGTPTIFSSLFSITYKINPSVCSNRGAL